MNLLHKITNIKIELLDEGVGLYAGYRIKIIPSEDLTGWDKLEDLNSVTALDLQRWSIWRKDPMELNGMSFFIEYHGDPNDPEDAYIYKMYEVLESKK